jgi:hypothetical protein
LTIILVLWSLFLEGASDAIFNHYLHADWSKINLFSDDPEVQSSAGKVWAAAFGQIFFTLSLGFGIINKYRQECFHYLFCELPLFLYCRFCCFRNCRIYGAEPGSSL